MFRRFMAVAASVCIFSSTASAQTATTTFDVQITIEEECLIISATNLDFGTSGVIDANIDQTSAVSVQCTDGTPYDVGLDAGTGGGTVDGRVMAGPGGVTIDYDLYQDAARTIIWGNTVGTDTVAGTGSGAAQSLTVYGRVPPQDTPATGTYTDTVTVTLTY